MAEELSNVFQQAAQRASVEVAPLSSLWYTRNDEMGVLTFLLPT